MAHGRKFPKKAVKQRVCTFADRLTFLEFFAGGGMAREGLGPDWRCLFANDVDSGKCAAYRDNYGGDHLFEGDIAAIQPGDLPTERPDLAWASFPCQDLSLAGARIGLAGARSHLFFEFWRLIEAAKANGRPPRIVAIENVLGLLTSNGGADFAALCTALSREGYLVSAITLNASHFTPQSRPRLFIFGFEQSALPVLSASPPGNGLAPAALLAAHGNLSDNTKAAWRWLSPAHLPQRNIDLADILNPRDTNWDTPEKTAALTAMMSPRQRANLDGLLETQDRKIGAAFRRVRMENGAKVQRLEARFDGLAGCLRTPAGGSSRQILLVIENKTVRSRLINPREAARLMGLSEEYLLPGGVTAALKLCGDGVSPPVVGWIAENIFTPALRYKQSRAA